MSYAEFISTRLPPICRNIHENHEVRFTNTGTLRIDGTIVNQKNIAETIVSLSNESFKFAEILTFQQNLNTIFLDFKKELMRLKSEFRRQDTHSQIVAFNYDELIPFVSIENKNNIVFYNSKTREIAPLDYNSYEMTVDKEFRRNPTPVMIEFNPYNPKHLYTGERYGIQCTHINSYKRPKWQLETELTYDQKKALCKLPKIFDDFMRHLFPDTLCRDYVYDWLHFLIAKRNETYLILNGAKGIGKNLFSEKLCKALIGEENHKLAPPSALESGFNALLVDSRLIVLDEFKIDDDEKVNRLKRYINRDQMIEYKGVDVSHTIETFNSFIISNNSITDNKIAWDDRRFSVADMTKHKLKDVWDKDKIDELLLALETDSQEIVNFGYWLLYRELKVMRNEFDWFAGPHFYKLCYSSMPEWAKVIIDLVTSGTRAEVTDADIKEEYRKRTGASKMPSTQKIQDFLSNYKHEGNHYLGELIREDSFWYINVSTHFVKSSQDSTGFDWNLL